MQKGIFLWIIAILNRIYPASEWALLFGIWCCQNKTIDCIISGFAKTKWHLWDPKITASISGASRIEDSFAGSFENDLFGTKIIFRICCYEIYISKYMKYYICKELLIISRFIKGCICVCVCHEICLSKYIKYCTCHEIFFWRFIKCSACHEDYASRCTKYYVCRSLAPITKNRFCSFNIRGFFLK